MLSSHELSRIRRQAHRRLRVVLAQRRIAAASHPDATPTDQATRPDRASAQPTQEH